MSAFEEHCNKIVNDYVQTVLIIDDGAGLGTTQNSDSDAGALKVPTPANPTGMMAVLTTTETPPKEEEQGDKSNKEQVTHLIDTLALTNAFYKRGIVAGIYQPQIEKGQDPEEFAKRAMDASSTADVLILDWMLDGSDDTYSKEIVKQILAYDKSSGGRLRTIVVYTGETNLHKLRDKLWDYLEDESLDRAIDFQINTEHLNIVFYNKMDATSALRPVSEEELPEKALKEFAVLVDGLVPAFAMKATTTLRQNTGALLAKFSSNLDSGYLAHRSLLPSPGDSELLMLENYASYLRNILALAQVDSETLGSESIEKWVDAKYDERHKKATVKNDEGNVDITLGKADFVESFKYGFNIEKDGLFKVIQRQLSSKKEAKKVVTNGNKVTNLESIVGAFGHSQGEAEHSSRLLVALTAFRRTFKDLVIGMPYLTQGTIIRSEDDKKYFACVMPKCDTARVSGERNFSFAKMKINAGRYDLIVPDIDDDDSFVHLETNLKFYELETIQFSSEGNVRVNAFNQDGHIKFSDTNGKEYSWIGDLEDLESQTKVSSIVGDFNRIGVDEVEWVRRRKVKQG